MNNYNNIFNLARFNYYGVELLELVFIASVLILSFFFRNIIANIIHKKLSKLITFNLIKNNDSYKKDLLDLLIKPLKMISFILGLFIISLFIEMNSIFGIYLKKMNITLFTIFIFYFTHQSLGLLSNYFSKIELIFTKALASWFVRSLKFLVIFLGLVAVLDLWGIKIGPVIAGLGLFGVAVALGAQDLFKNLISGIMIIIERRFSLGDVISIPGHTEGTVEYIGFRSTLIRKFDTTPISIPNYVFAETAVLNYSNRNYRRINWIIGLTYDSQISQLKKFNDNLSSFISSNNKFIVNDNFKCFVKLDKFNDNSIDVLIYCFTSTNDWEKYLEIKEELALYIKKLAEEIGLNFAFPSRTIYLEKK